MLAVLSEDYFDDPDWIYERKLDGVRVVVVKQGNELQLYSRNQKVITDSYPELEKPLLDLSDKSLVADGEIVAFDGNLTSFSKLQKRMQVKDRGRAMKLSPKVYLYLFDLIYYDQYDLRKMPLRQRKKALHDLLKFDDRLRYCAHRNEQGKAYHKEACAKGWEGIIAKDAGAGYVSSRSKKWLKFKCTAGQELVIAGFTEPQGSRKGFGALLVGYYENNELHYAGKVGTGFDTAFLKKWRQKFDRIERKTSAFSDFKDSQGGRNHWLSPQYVGEFGFTEWTADNKLRHPRFLGIRDDKDPQEVVKEKS